MGDSRVAAGYLAAGLLTAYQIPQLARIIRRRSAADFSIPAYIMVVCGLAAYCYSVWYSPGRFAACVSLTNSLTLLGTVLYYRLIYRPRPSR